jgi:hypothetical protein
MVKAVSHAKFIEQKQYLLYSRLLVIRESIKSMAIVGHISVFALLDLYIVFNASLGFTHFNAFYLQAK